MKKIVLLSLSFLLIAGCATTTQESTNEDSSAQSSQSSAGASMYKKSFYGEIPITWSHVLTGDIEPMPYTENMWIDHEYIIYSIGEYDVSFGDTNWTQVDLAFMDSNDMARSVAFFKNSDDVKEYVQEWTQETVDGRTADVATFKTEPDGSVSKGGTGGKMYFIPNAINGMGLVIAKQALGDEGFESGFAHYMESLDFDM